MFKWSCWTPETEQADGTTFFQGQIQALKKTASKGDKKKKKEVGDEIARMTEEMEVRHKRELDELRASDPVAGVAEDIGTALALGQDAAVAADEDGETGNAVGRVSKAQKRRDAKARKEKERREEIERQEEENKFGARQVEADAIAARLKAQ